MRYRCLDCDSDFDERDGLVTVLEPHSELDGCPTEKLTELRCPICGADFWSLEEYTENA